MSRLAEVIERLFTAANVAQLAALAVAAMVAWLGHGITKRWYLTRSETGIRLSGLLLEALVVVSPYVAALAALAVARSLIVAAALDTALLAHALRLAIALIIVRLAVFGLRRSVSPTSR